MCICLGSTSPLCITGCSDGHQYRLSTKFSAQEETCPSEINYLSLIDTLINDSALPISGRGGWLSCVSFQYHYVISYFYCVWNPQISLHPPVLSTNLWNSDTLQALHPVPVTVFTKTRSCLREHFSALWGGYRLWWSIVGNGAALQQLPPELLVHDPAFCYDIITKSKYPDNLLLILII